LKEIKEILEGTLMTLRAFCSVLTLAVCLSLAPGKRLRADPPLPPDEQVARQIRDRGLTDLNAYSLLAELTSTIGGRLSGSPQAAAAVQWGQQTMRKLGFQNVHLEPVMVPHWVRGSVEVGRAWGPNSKTSLTLHLCALGGSVGTPPAGIEGEVIEVHSLKEAGELGNRARGKILFYNRPMDPTLLNTFAAYGGAVDQRYAGASVAARVGAVAVLVRSLSLAIDTVPHTGAMHYEDGVPRIPAVAISTQDANRLSNLLKADKAGRARLQVDCQTLPDVESANVVGELVGSEKPNEVIVMGGHLDSWDKGVGAHDDGAGVTQSLEALGLLKRLGLMPKRTIRVVLFMNEENGARGAAAYAARHLVAQEQTVAAMESDSGGFAPHGFGVVAKPGVLGRIQAWSSLLKPLEADRITEGGPDTDIAPLGARGVPLISLEPESQRYFDYHHSVKDTLDTVNPRELEIGAIAMATLALQIAQQGL
jgi:carboxypeptidase Q